MGDYFTVQLNTVGGARQMIQFAVEEFPEVQIRYRISTRISTEGYQTIMNEIILENIQRGRQDFVLNARPSPFNQPPTVTVCTPSEVEDATALYGDQFIVRVGGGVSRGQKQRILLAASLANVEVWNAF